MFITNFCRRFKAFSFFIASLIAYLVQAHAMNVEPVSAELSDSGQNSKITLHVMNDGAQSIPVEILAFKLTLAEDGKQTTSPAKDKFLIYPSQGTIAARATQSFRVQWLGGANLKAAHSSGIARRESPE